jgi:hypothetical protein
MGQRHSIWEVRQNTFVSMRWRTSSIPISSLVLGSSSFDRAAGHNDITHEPAGRPIHHATGCHRSQRAGRTVSVLITQRSLVQIQPPPPLKRWSARLVHRALAPDRHFRVRASALRSRFSGLFLGTYSVLPHAAPCRAAPRTRSLRSGFALESAIEVSLRGAAQGMPDAIALVNISLCSLDRLRQMSVAIITRGPTLPVSETRRCGARTSHGRTGAPRW